ncbi:MAG: hypothetical protein ACLP3R_05375, partial [Candidatus Korobacteraceae bacterium]
QQHPSGSSGYKPSSGSSDVDKEAQDRSRGAQQSQRFSQYQHSSGGGDRWGGGGGRGGGGFGGRR